MTSKRQATNAGALLARGRKYFFRVSVLFLAASLAPALFLSFAYAGIASSAVLRASEERGKAAAQAFSAGFRALVEGADTSLSLIAAAPESGSALSARDRGASEEASASVGRLLAREASREAGFAFALVSASGERSFGTRTLPGDWDAGAYGNWGIFRKARESPGAVFDSRRRVAENGEAALIVAARALRDGSGSVTGFALAEIDRSALVRAAKAGGFGLTADFELVSSSRQVAFSLADGSREGFYEDELPPRGAEGEGYEAPSAASFSARAYLPSSLLEDFSQAMRRATLAGLAACAALAIALALAASRIVASPVLALSGAMRALRSGDLSVRLVPTSKDELGDLMVSFNATAEELGRLMREIVEDQELIRGAELRALAARMNPHFLYNSLNSIRSLAKLGRDREIIDVVTRLGKILRAYAGNRADLSTVGDGLELVRHYLAIEKIRFGDSISFEEDVAEDALRCELPSLVLEPLAENALTHGLERKGGKGTLRIEGRIEGAAALISFEDDGPGVPAEELADLAALLESGEMPPDSDEGDDRNGLGLAATNRRLRLRYGEGFGIGVSAGRGGKGFRAEVRVPAGESRACAPS
jgi:two-component system, sensor histidine kinase YesM